MTGELSRGPARWKYSSGEDAAYLQLDEKTPEALLQLGIEYTFLLRSIVVRLWSSIFGSSGVVSEITICICVYSNLNGKNDERQYLAGSFSGALSSQKVTEEFKGQLGANGNRADSVMAQAGLTVRRICQTDAKAEHSEPTLCIRCRRRLSDKSYSGDNRLVVSKSPNRRYSSAPRCRLNLSWGWRRSQGYGCSPFKKLRELGSDRTGYNDHHCNLYTLNP